MSKYGILCGTRAAFAAFFLSASVCIRVAKCLSFHYSRAGHPSASADMFPLGARVHKRLPENKHSFSGSLYHAIDFVSILFQQINILHIIDHHERNLKSQRIIKLSNVEPSRLVQLLNPVDQRISVYIELTRCL